MLMSLKHEEPYASARREAAAVLRRVHRESPAFARLLNRRLKEAERKMIERFWNTPTGIGGLHSLLD
jgi:hypothetical protein